MKWFSTFSVRGSLAWLMASLLSAVVAGCGGGGGGDAGPGTGTLGVSLTDAPSCGYDQVNVTVVKVRVHKSAAAGENDAGWTDITLASPTKINLLNLNNGVLFNLGQTTLEAGHYTQLRLVLDANATGTANTVVPTGGTATALVTPSAVQSGIKLINEFDVVADQRVDLVLDFDACKSVVKRGNGTYALKPVIRVIPTELNGIKGFVDVDLLDENVLLTAQQNGVVIQSTAPLQSGEFFLARVPAGNYDVVITADGRATAVIAGVPVANSTSVTTINGTGAPIMLETSAMQTVTGAAVLNPTSTTVDANVAAKQTFGVLPAPTTTVTVKSVIADDLAAGAYTLNLPTAEPWFATYDAAATSPAPSFVLTEQTGMAGMYAVAASATGYTSTPSSIDVDISGGPATDQNFALAP